MLAAHQKQPLRKWMELRLPGAWEKPGGSSNHAPPPKQVRETPSLSLSLSLSLPPSFPLSIGTPFGRTKDEPISELLWSKNLLHTPIRFSCRGACSSASQVCCSRDLGCCCRSQLSIWVVPSMDCDSLATWARNSAEG